MPYDAKRGLTVHIIEIVSFFCCLHLGSGIPACATWSMPPLAQPHLQKDKLTGVQKVKGGSQYTHYELKFSVKEESVETYQPIANSTALLS